MRSLWLRRVRVCLVKSKYGIHILFRSSRRSTILPFILMVIFSGKSRHVPYLVLMDIITSCLIMVILLLIW